MVSGLRFNASFINSRAEGERLLRKAISAEGDPDYSDPYFQLGLLYYSQIHSKRAVNFFLDANKANMRDGKGTNAPAIFYAGLVSLDLSKGSNHKYIV